MAKKLSGGAIAGITLGSIVVAGGLTAVIVCVAVPKTALMTEISLTRNKAKRVSSSDLVKYAKAKAILAMCDVYEKANKDSHCTDEDRKNMISDLRKARKEI